MGEAAIGISSDRQFLGPICRMLPSWFPHLPDQSQYNRRLQALVADLDRAAAARALARCGRCAARRRRLDRRRQLPRLPVAQRVRRLRASASPSRSTASSTASEHHLARTPAGLAVRIVQRILALILGMLLKHLRGPPSTRPRHLRRPLNHIKPLLATGMKQVSHLPSEDDGLPLFGVGVSNLPRAGDERGARSPDPPKESSG